jgi:general secretion pathway protein I
VLVALVVAALGLAALALTMTQTVRTSIYLRERTLANWIALNRITEQRISGKVPENEEIEGDVDYAGQHWRWKLVTQKTAVTGIVRLDAFAAPEGTKEDSWPGQATGFMGDAIAPRTGADVNWLGNPGSAPPGGPPGTPPAEPPETPTPQPGDPST